MFGFTLKSRLLTASAVAFVSFGLTAGAHAQCSVVDPPNLAKNALTSQNLMSEVGTVTGILGKVTDTKSAIGSSGGGLLSQLTGGGGSGGLGGLGGISKFFSLSSLNIQPPNMSSVFTTSRADGTGGLPPGSADFSTVTSSSNWVQTALVPSDTTTATRTLVHERRAAALNSAAQEGYALALSLRNDAAGGAERAAALKAAADSATDLRTQIAALSAVNAALNDVMAKIIAARAAQLQIEASQAIAATGLNPATPAAK